MARANKGKRKHWRREVARKEREWRATEIQPVQPISGLSVRESIQRAIRAGAGRGL